MAGKPFKSPDTLKDRRPQRMARRTVTPAIAPVDAESALEAAQAPVLYGPAPPAPRGLLKSSRELWGQIWGSAIRPALLDSDVGALVRYIQLVDERDRAFREHKRARIVAGSMGQERTGPFWAIVRDCEALIRRYEEAFGLTPQARMRLNISQTQALSGVAALNAQLDAAGAAAADPLAGGEWMNEEDG